ncbi:molybdopterin biosynthesis protein [Arhodomonas sp. SL1]|uniref:molybdopterin biosynthesis protein n=1 Tax=Arhodomonas sp. SL1 TaxID=3425691 RepID=UPI003F885396
MRAGREGNEQSQFLDTVSREEAIERFFSALDLSPRGSEPLPLDACPGRVLAADATAAVDVPGFDRANVDGVAVRSSDLASASEEAPVTLTLTPELLTPGMMPQETVSSGTASAIATGGMIPRGADAVVMVEHTETVDGGVAVSRPLHPGAFVTHAGSDIALGETVLYAGQPLGSREIGLLAAVGLAEVPVWRRPRIAILSTGDEILPPGAPARPGAVYDSNGAILAAAVRENGGEPLPLGICPDDEAAIASALERALEADVVLLSGGTSKGAGDVVHRVVARLRNPGVLVHGVALRPGKPLCLAVHDGVAIAVLPGFPTSAIFTFHEFIVPVIRRLAGLPPRRREVVTARLPMDVPSEYGRVDYRMVGLLPQADGTPAAYPSPKGSGAVTAFSRADGFIAIGARSTGMGAGSEVEVQCLEGLDTAADLVAVGSHCTGLDHLLGRLRREGHAVRSMHVGSLGGVAAAGRGDCDIAGVHLLDSETDRYNSPWLPEGVTLVPGYRRRQGICLRPDDERLTTVPLETLAERLRDDPDLVMVNRNHGSGTRVLIDRLLDGLRPPGWGVQPASHNAVAAAVAQGRADWGMTIEPVARAYGLAFVPVRDEHYDFMIPDARLDRPAVTRFRELLAEPEVREALTGLGFTAAG